jgi:L-amino acid N-acyltransferase YncA
MENGGFPVTLLPFSPFNSVHAEYYRDCGFRVCSDMKGIVAHDAYGDIMGITVMDNWSYTSVYGHIRVTNPLCLRHGGLVTETMIYVFDTCGMVNFLGSVPADNIKAIEFEKKLGFQEVYRLKDGWKRGVDALMMRMTREQAVYLPKNLRAA